VGSDTHWQHLCGLMDRPDLVAHGATLADRTRHHDELDQVVAAWCAGQDTTALARALGRAGIPSSPVVDPIDLRHDPQVAARGTLADLVHPATPDRPSGYLGAALPIRLSAFTATPSPAETLGASTDQVLSEFLGLTPSELDGLRSRRVI
jgi:crotonobetainyl-CoA:carnitine CoA-transferase CaiB-like acyl-CoA transferase